MKRKLSNEKQFLLLAVGGVMVIAIVVFWWWSHRAVAAEFIMAQVERGNLRQAVTATGTLQALTTVQVGSQVSGTISALHADFNSQVRKGQIVAQLDPAIFEAQLASARANLEQARANLANAQAKVLAAQSNIENLTAGVSSAAANLAALKAQRDDAKSLLERQQELAKSGVIAQSDLETSRTTYQADEERYHQAAAQLDQARADEQSAAQAGLAESQAQVKQAQAQVKESEATVRLAEVNLSYTTIRSPIDGVVVLRNIDVGQTVAASLQAPTLFNIANDLTHMQIIANIDQADIGAINASNRISFTVDAYPGEIFAGTIRQLRLNAQNVDNVVTYNAVIDVDNSAFKLKPGMTANLTFTIAEREQVLKVPNAALRFIPQGVTPQQVREMLRGAKGNESSQGPSGNETPSGSLAGPGEGSAGRNGGQRGNAPAATATTNTSAVLAGQWRMVWLLGADHKPQGKKIKLGITDGTSAEVAEGEVKEGETVIIAQNITTRSQPTNSQRPPGSGAAGGARPR